MATVRILPGGTSGGCAPVEVKSRGKRGAIKGWSAGAARRNLRFLWSVNVDLLGDAPGYAVTLTTGHTPETAVQWADAREAWLKRATRAGVTRYHWVTEWTAKGRPHMHAAVYGPERATGALLLAWLEVADANGWPVNVNGQHIVPIKGASGWLQYVSKHAARGVVHYQREGAPEGWETTGRLWGYGGDWPVEDEEVVDLTPGQYVMFRTLMWDWLLADMERRELPREFIDQTAARWANPEHGNAHGVSGWIPGDVAYAFAQAAKEAVPDRYDWET